MAGACAWTQQSSNKLKFTIAGQELAEVLLLQNVLGKANICDLFFLINEGTEEGMLEAFRIPWTKEVNQPIINFAGERKLLLRIPNF